MNSKTAVSFSSAIFQANYRQAINFRLMLPMLLVALFFVPALQDVVIQVLSEAFLQVGVLVAGTLAGYAWISQALSKHQRLSSYQFSGFGQIVFAALLGVLPGCGGAIIVITQFSRGQTSFAAVIAVLISTMGDAAFLLLAQRPWDALLIMFISFLTAILAGFIVSKLHHADAFRPARKTWRQCNKMDEDKATSALQQSAFIVAMRLWRWLLLPCLVLAGLIAFQVDADQLLGLPAGSIALFAAVLGFLTILLWALSGPVKAGASSNYDPRFAKVVSDTQFVLSWVVCAFLLFEVSQAYFSWSLFAGADDWGWWSVMLGVGIGLVPGCGPQILVTGMYLQGAIPFSAQLANALSNDGDALFPAIALVPKAALVATLYSSIPALLVGWGFYVWFEL